MCFDLLALPRVFQSARKPPCRKVQRPKNPGPRNCCPGPRMRLPSLPRMLRTKEELNEPLLGPTRRRSGCSSRAAHAVVLFDAEKVWWSLHRQYYPRYLARYCLGLPCCVDVVVLVIGNSARRSAVANRCQNLSIWRRGSGVLVDTA